MLKIDIVSGFLGAGKTTFIKRLLKTKITNEKVVLIENEFGEVSVDGDFLRDSKIQIQELSQGCICCSLVGDFSKSLNEVIATYHPDRILIEPSGVGKLSDVKKAVVDAGLGEYLNSFICLVDASKAKMYSKNFGEFFSDQIASASTVILSRTDVASAKKIEEALEIVRSLNSQCEVVATPIEELSDEALFDAYEGVSEDMLKALLEETSHHDEDECECEHHHHDHDEDECECGHHHHDHDEDECECGHHHHDHDEDECECGHHHHDHDEDECECGHHHHDHDEETCSCGHHHHHHHADEVFQSIGMETTKVYDSSELAKILDKLSLSSEYGIILRAKGLVKTEDGWKQFNLTPDEVAIETGNAIAIGKICVIGSGLKEDEIKKMFN